MKVVVVSSLLPSGHYSQYLTRGLYELDGLELIVYTDKDAGNLKISRCGQIKNVWTKSLRYIIDIMSELKIDKPDVVHLQHEINMFGGTLTAVAFPFLLLLIKLRRIRRIVTIHCVVPGSMVDRKFAAYFHKDSFLMRPWVIRMFFSYLYRTIACRSDGIIVHTQMTKDTLLHEYGVPNDKVAVIAPIVPERQLVSFKHEDYFFYFGYIVRRKGLPYVLSGFKKFLENNPDCPYNLVLAGGTIKGQDGYRQDILDLIASDKLLSLRVIVKGFVEEDELDALYGRAVAVVIPAEISMGASGPLYHAFSYQKCVLASKVGHLVEEIVHLKTGYLVDNNHWQEAFQFCLVSPENVRLIEQRAGEIAISRAPSLIVQQHAELYRKICHA